MREAIGESNMVIVTIILLAVFITGGITIRNNVTNSVKKSDSVNCAKYGYSYDASANKCVDIFGNKFNMPGITQDLNDQGIDDNTNQNEELKPTKPNPNAGTNEDTNETNPIDDADKPNPTDGTDKPNPGIGIIDDPISEEASE